MPFNRDFHALLVAILRQWPKGNVLVASCASLKRTNDSLAEVTCVTRPIGSFISHQPFLASGYIAMLAVDAPYRGKSIGLLNQKVAQMYLACSIRFLAGSALVMKAVALMKEKGCNLVCACVGGWVVGGRFSFDPTIVDF